jgi:hypothetical protein
MHFFGFVLFVGLAGILVYVLVVYRAIPGAVEERLGKLQALPENLGNWQIDEDSEEAKSARAAGRIREVRWFYREANGWFGKELLVRQIRYRDDSGAIVHTEPDQVERRRRIRQG